MASFTIEISDIHGDVHLELTKADPPIGSGHYDRTPAAETIVGIGHHLEALQHLGNLIIQQRNTLRGLAIGRSCGPASYALEISDAGGGVFAALVKSDPPLCPANGAHYHDSPAAALTIAIHTYAEALQRLGKLILMEKPPRELPAQPLTMH